MSCAAIHHDQNVSVFTWWQQVSDYANDFHSFGWSALFSSVWISHCSLEDVHFYSLSRSCILHLFTKTNVGMSNTSYSCGYSPCALYALAAQMMQSWKKWRRLIWLSKRARRWTN